MNPESGRSFRLFRLFGINVRLHWLWFLVAAYQFSNNSRGYNSLVWNAAEYLGLFLLVLLHEFGHALACRQVGGTANEIVLWPLGGVAYVSPPPRPGALLWSIVAGPLVNVALIPVFYFLVQGGGALNLPAMPLNGYRLIERLQFINYGLLIFNILPIYPLDGGQILRALLWYLVGRARSLKAASILGLFGAAGLIALAVWMESVWIGVMAAYMAMNCWNGFRSASQLSAVQSAPRRAGFACPACQVLPAEGDWWVCPACQQGFDAFANNATCPHCQKMFSATTCMECGERTPLEAWRTQALTGSGIDPR